MDLRQSPVILLQLPQGQSLWNQWTNLYTIVRNLCFSRLHLNAVNCLCMNLNLITHQDKRNQLQNKPRWFGFLLKNFQEFDIWICCLSPLHELLLCWWKMQDKLLPKLRHKSLKSPPLWGPCPREQEKHDSGFYWCLLSEHHLFFYLALSDILYFTLVFCFSLALWTNLAKLNLDILGTIFIYSAVVPLGIFHVPSHDACNASCSKDCEPLLDLMPAWSLPILTI